MLDFAAAPAAETVPILDDGKLKSLEAVIGADALATMLAMIPEEAAVARAALAVALAAADMRAAREAAHALKGVAANFGADRLAALARAIEIEAVDAEAVRRLLPALDRAIAETNGLIAAR